MMPGQFRVDGHGRTVILTHFAYHTGRNFVQDGVLQAEVVVACQPALEHLSGWQRTQETAVVNCPACEETEKFKVAAREQGIR